MHQLIATLLSLMLGLCHHLAHTVHPVQAAEAFPASTLRSADLTAPAVILPDRYQLARSTRTYR